MPNHDPNFGVAFVAAILVVAIFATLFPEKVPEHQNQDLEHLNKKTPPSDDVAGREK